MQFLTIKDCPELTKHFDIFLDGRKEVIKYFENEYGKDNVCQVGAFGTEETKIVLRDVASALGLPYQEIIALNKVIPSDAGQLWTLDECLYGNSDKGYEPIQEVIDYKNKDQLHQELFDAALKIRGVKKTKTIHAGGVVITPQPVEEMVPLFNGANDEKVTQYDKVDCEKAGLVKLDILGLKSLGIYYQTLKNIKNTTGEELSFSDIPIDDEKALHQIKIGNTCGLFQIESRWLHYSGDIIMKIL